MSLFPDKKLKCICTFRCEKYEICQVGMFSEGYCVVVPVRILSTGEINLFKNYQP